MRSYGQLCGVAKALDVVGGRWTLLIVRDLIPGPRRYRDLLAGLPGITTNLLAERLKALVADGLIEKRDLPPPAPATVYCLTERGQELEPVVLALGRFGHSYLQPAGGGDARDVRWTMLSLMRRYQGGLESMDMEITVAQQEFSIRVNPDGLRVRDGALGTADIRLGAEESAWFRFISGGEGARQLLERGLFQLQGRRRELARFARAIGARA